jgi:Zn-dependent protease with chaperone function
VTFDARFAIVILAAFASASIVASLVAVWQWRRARVPAAPVDRATFIFHLRLLPLVASSAWASLAMVSFFFFEPRASGERIGAVLLLSSIAGLTLLFGAAMRVTVAIVRHRRLLRTWLENATPIDLPGISIPALAIDTTFPVVAVVGVFRPRLVIARRVLDACPPEELAAILDHERGHIRRRDNARRMLLLALPDPMSWTRIGRAIDLAWHDAAEEVADEAPGDGRGDAGRIALAAALVRVARMVSAGETLSELPASALYRGEPLEHRVRRLLDPIPPRPRAPRHYQWIALATFIGLSIVLLNPIHQLLEAAVTLLP